MKRGRPDLTLVALDPASAVSDIGTIASGPDVPRPFLWFVDALCITTAFLAAYVLAPWIKALALDPQSFLRIHRSHIVNTRRIRQLWSLPHGQYLIEMQSGERLQSGRTYGDRIRSALTNPFSKA